LKLKREREREFDLKKLRVKGFLGQWSGQMDEGSVDPPFIAPIGNLPIAVSKIRTCLVRELDKSEKYF
jgi:hypothetical protein